MTYFSMAIRRTNLTKLVVSTILFSLLGNVTIAQEVSTAQKKELRKLYPKLNSKMARMEEILNYTDRFLGDKDFKMNVLTGLKEFVFLAKESKNDIPFYLPEKEVSSYKKAIDKTAKLGMQLYQAVKDSDQKSAKKYFNALDTLRRKSHSKWAE